MNGRCKFMNIQSVTPKFYDFKNKNNFQNTSVQKRNTFVSMPSVDTVSFSGVLKSGKPAVNTISDVIAAGIEKNKDRMTRIATTYLDVLESISLSLKKHGFSFDREYCEMSPVKSAESFVSKISRSGSMRVPDAIRATIYYSDPYNLTPIVEGLLPEMQKRGYVLANTEKTVEDLLKRGYVMKSAKNLQETVSVPDLDIRLEGISEQVVVLPPELRYSVGKPQRSGYEDVQMRFVRVTDKSDYPVNHELIILFGPNYASAKHLESTRIYAHLRDFNKLRMKFEDNTVGSNSQKAQRYIDLIEQMFRGKVSQKLFLNAKNKDLFAIEEEIPIRFSKEDISLVETYFAGLNDKLNSCYVEKRKAGNPSQLVLKELTQDKRHDRALIKKIQEGLSSAVEYFNHVSGVKETK